MNVVNYLCQNVVLFAAAAISCVDSKSTYSRTDLVAVPVPVDVNNACQNLLSHTNAIRGLIPLKLYKLTHV